jgi:hypothetical protein
MKDENKVAVAGVVGLYISQRQELRERMFFGSLAIAKYPAMYVMNEESLSQHR